MGIVTRVKRLWQLSGTKATTITWNAPFEQSDVLPSTVSHTPTFTVKLDPDINRFVPANKPATIVSMNDPLDIFPSDENDNNSTEQPPID